MWMDLFSSVLMLKTIIFDSVRSMYSAPGLQYMK